MWFLCNKSTIFVYTLERLWLLFLQYLPHSSNNWLNFSQLPSGRLPLVLNFKLISVLVIIVDIESPTKLLLPIHLDKISFNEDRFTVWTQLLCYLILFSCNMKSHVFFLILNIKDFFVWHFNIVCEIKKYFYFLWRNLKYFLKCAK